MKRTVVRYRTKPEDSDENQRLIEGVFEELHATSPAGLRYLALRLDDGSFVHFVMAEGERAAGPMAGVKAFGAFQAGIRERCVEPPKGAEATIVGDYKMLAK